MVVQSYKRHFLCVKQSLQYGTGERESERGGKSCDATLLKMLRSLVIALALAAAPVRRAGCFQINGATVNIGDDSRKPAYSGSGGAVALLKSKISRSPEREREKARCQLSLSVLPVNCHCCFSCKSWCFDQMTEG